MSDALEGTRSRALVVVAALRPLPLRRDLEAVLGAERPQLAAEAVEGLLADGLLEVVRRHVDGAERVRLTDAGRRSFETLPGD